MKVMQFRATAREAAVFADTEFKLPINSQSGQLDPRDTDPH